MNLTGGKIPKRSACAAHHGGGGIGRALGHPWLFADSIHESNRAGQLGELACSSTAKTNFSPSACSIPTRQFASAFCMRQAGHD